MEVKDVQEVGKVEERIGFGELRSMGAKRTKAIIRDSLVAILIGILLIALVAHRVLHGR
jgi:hypothetical protein